MRKAKEEMLAEVYRLLVINLGEPPIKFDWRYEPVDKSDDKDEEDNEGDGNEEDDEDLDEELDDEELEE